MGFTWMDFNDRELQVIVNVVVLDIVVDKIRYETRILMIDVL